MRLVSLVVISALLSGCAAESLSAEERLLTEAKTIGFARADYEIKQTVGQSCSLTAFDDPTITGATLTYAFQLSCTMPTLDTVETFYTVLCKYELGSTYRFLSGTYMRLSQYGQNATDITEGWARPACPPSE